MIGNVKVCSHRVNLKNPLLVWLSTKEHSQLVYPPGMYSLLHTTDSCDSWVQGIKVQTDMEPACRDRKDSLAS